MTVPVPAFSASVWDAAWPSSASRSRSNLVEQARPHCHRVLDQERSRTVGEQPSRRCNIECCRAILDARIASIPCPGIQTTAFCTHLPRSLVRSSTIAFPKNSHRDTCAGRSIRTTGTRTPIYGLWSSGSIRPARARDEYDPVRGVPNRSSRYIECRCPGRRGLVSVHRPILELDGIEW